MESENLRVCFDATGGRGSYLDHGDRASFKAGYNFIKSSSVNCTSHIIRGFQWRKKRCANNMTLLGAEDKCEGVLVRWHEGKRQLERLRCRWDDVIKIFLWMEGCALYLFGSEQRRVAGFCEHGNELSGFIACGDMYKFFWLRKF